MCSNKEYLRIATRNAAGITSSSSYLSDVLERNYIHICGLSEHMLMGYENDTYYCSLNYHEQTIELLSGFPSFSMEDSNRVALFKTVARSIHYVLHLLYLRI
jgi:hypothetical protein